MLTALVTALMAGCKSLAEAEVLTAELAPVIRRRLKLPRRLADTTARDTLVALAPEQIAALVRQSAQVADRRKALVEDFPLSTVAMDGKGTAVEEMDGMWAIRQRSPDRLTAFGVVRTISCVLTSCPARPFLEVVPMGKGGNEGSFFRTAFETLREHHPSRFDVVTYDAGANSATNAQLVVDSGKDYVFALKDSRRFLHRAARHVLAHKPPSTALHSTEDVLNKAQGIRVLRHLHVAEVPRGYKAMKSVRTILRVHSEKVSGSGEVLAEENRYFISSLKHDRLTWSQWLELVRRHWGVEVCHNVLDTSFQEDMRPWLTHSAQGMLVVMILRRLAYNLLSLWKNVSLRSEESRATPWKMLFRWIANTLIAAPDDVFNGIRARKVLPAFS